MCKRKRILLVAATTGYQTQAFAQAADRAGIALTLATDRCHVLEDPWGDGALAVRFDDPEAAAQAIAAAVDVDGIAAVADHPAYIASLAAARMGLPFHPAEAVRASGDKFLARERFRAAGLPVPDYFRVPASERAEDAAPRAAYPCVLKPTGLSASRGVIRADDKAAFLKAFARIRALLASPDVARLGGGAIHVERFIPGREFAVEGLMTHGRLRVLAIFDKPDPLDGPFFEETIYTTPSRESGIVQAAIRRAAEQAAAALGLTHGPVHAEMRVNEEGVWMLEMAARPIGGLCARVLPGLEELILRHAAGDAGAALDSDGRARGVMMIPVPQAGVFAEALGVEEARAVSGIDGVEITAKTGQKLVPLPEGNSYPGFLFASAATPAEAEAALREAHGKLRFAINEALPVMGSAARVSS